MTKVNGKSQEIDDLLNSARLSAWNDCISPRLESLRGWLGGDEWSKGLGAYLRAVLAQQHEYLITGCKSRDDDQYARGRITMLREILGLPAAIEKQIAAIEQNKERQETVGQAGY